MKTSIHTTHTNLLCCCWIEKAIIVSEFAYNDDGTKSAYLLAHAMPYFRQMIYTIRRENYAEHYDGCGDFLRLQAAS